MSHEERARRDRRSNRRIRIGYLVAIAIGVAMLLGLPAGKAAVGGTALQLNGSSQYATLGTTSDLRSATFTVELWFQRTGAGVGTSTGTGGIASAIPLIAKGRAEAETAAADINYFLGIDSASGRLVADFEEGQSGANPSTNHPLTGNVTGVIAADSAWHHAALTYDGTTLHLYLDGADDGSLTVSQPANAATNVLTSVGSALTTTGTPSGYFAGAVDEVRIWNTARTLNEIQTTKNTEITSPQSGLLGVWNLNEGSGSSLADNSGNATNGASVAGPSWVPGFVPPNSAPVATADSYTTPQDTTLNVAAPGVLGNDTDADSDTLTAVKVSDPAHGTLTLGTAGDVTYVPTAGYNGPDSFTYTANDGSLDSNVVTVDLTVSPASATTYYVDKTNGSCSDAGPGSIARPFCTIGKGASVATAGQTVRVLAGTYAETVNGPNSGTAGNPITFSAAPGVVVTGNGTSSGNAFRLSSKNYIVIDGFTVSGTVDYGIYAASSNHITISNDQVSSAGSPVSGSTRMGIYFSNTDDSTITGTTTDHNSQDGIRLTGGSSGNVVSDNVSYANAEQWERNATGIQVTGTGSDNNTIIHNITYGNEDSGLQFYSGAKSNLVIGNLSYGNGDHGIDNNAAPNNTIVGNTIQGNVTSGINLEGSSSPGSGGATLANNISVDNGLRLQVGGGTASGQPTNIRVDAQSVAGTTIDYDEVYLSSGTGMIQWNGTTYASLALFKAAVPGQETHGLEADPLFTAPAAIAQRPASAPFNVAVNTGDYHLTAGSPAIDSANASASNEATADLDGHPRIDDPATTDTGAGPRTYDDRGAYEFTPASNSAPVAVADSYSTPEGTAKVVPAPGVLGNDTDADNDSLSAVLVSDVSHGTLALASDGGFTYTPSGGYSGPDSFTYKANDGTADSNTVTVSLTVTAASTNTALQLNGSSQYATLGTTSDLRSATFTVELWFQRTGAGVGTSTGTGGIASAIPLIAKGRAEAETAAADINYFLGIDSASGRLVADFEEGQSGANPSTNHPLTGNVTGVIAADSAWHHAALTYDGTTLHLYLDGADDGSLTVSQPANAATNVLTSVGSALTTTGTPSGYFAGAVDEVRIWNTARTLNEIQTTKNTEITSPQSGLLGVWNLNEGSGSSLADNSGNATNGASVAGPSWVPGFVPPSSGNGAPDAPTLNAPTDAATGIGLSPTLDVTVSDPDADPLTVTYYGRPLASGNFTQIAQHTNITSGSNDTATWPSLGAGQTYEWYVTLNDGTNTTTGPTWTFHTTPSSDPVFVGVGDIAACTNTNDTATAAVIQGVDGSVFTTGDNVYPNGTASDFANCYDPSWGIPSIKSRTRPIPGNHDWGAGVTDSLAGYNGYFGAAATDANGKSYYSYDIPASNWHVVNLDSECEDVPGGCTSGSPQELWLKADLAANSSKNVIALWHKPRFSSAATNLTDVQPFVDDLYAAGADLVMVGHDHVYERIAPLDASGTPDPTYGIRYITIGTGGDSHQSFGTPIAGSEVREANTYGILKLTLHPSSYDWVFLPIAGSTFTDSGTGTVHGAPTASNHVPVAVADSYSTPEGTAKVVPAPGVLGNDTDADNDSLSAVLVSDVSHGTLALASDGGFTYTPSGGYSGPDSFTYKANDGTADSNTVTVSLTVTAASTNTALQLNGSSQYATLGTTSDLRSATFTVELWFQRTGAGVGTSTGTGGIASAIPLIAKGRAEAETAAADINYFLGIDSASGRLVADFEEGQSGANPSTNHPLTGNVTGVIAADSAWHHAALTYDGTTLHLYLDGADDGSLTVSQPANAATNVLTSVGSALTTTGTPSGYFAGAVDEVRIWNTARTLNEIQTTKNTEITSPQSGLLGVWNLNEGSGSSLADNSGNATNGASVAGPSWVPGFVPPSSGNGAPDAPTLNAPTDAATGIGLSPTLDVTVSDPDADPLTVTYYGRPLASGNFTQIAQHTNITSGSNDTATWPSLGAGQTYEWYVTLNDGTNTTTGPTWTFHTTPSSDPVFVGVGDIASCAVTEDTATGNIIAGIDGNVFTVGDNVYENGTASDFANCYATTPWGSPGVKSRTRPAPGNHDWGAGVTDSLAGYNGYFGAAATDANGKSYYSYDIPASNWHVVNLDSECEDVPGGCTSGSPQELWLKADLAANAGENVIAIWHKPRYSSGATNYQALQPLWDDLYAAGVDILLDGHDHIYERFAPMKSGAALSDPPVADPTYGIRQFTIGTGGEGHHGLVATLPTSQVRNDQTFGIFKLTLHATTYDWVFLPIDGSTFTDSGTGTVHPAPSPPGLTTLQPGASLAAGQSIASPDGVYRLKMQSDGNLVEYDGASVVWAAGTNPSGASAVMQGDGNFVVYNSSNDALWSSQTSGNPGAYVALGDGGVFGVRSGGVMIWAPGNLVSGNTLTAGQSLFSPAGRYRLTMQGDGNLVEYTKSGIAVWASSTAVPGSRAVVQADGNIVVYDGAAQALWASDTSGHPGAYLRLRDTGELTVESATGALLWAGPAELVPDSVLTAGQTLRSPTSAYRLTMQGDGNLVEYDAANTVVWTTGTSSGSRVVMQGDGNLVLYDGTNHALWASNTSGHPGAYLSLLDTGQLLVDGPGGSPLWAGPGALLLDQTLTAGQTLSSPTGAYQVTMRSDGNLVETHGASEVWSSGTSSAGSHAVMQGDGNLVVYSSTSQPQWASNSSGNPGSYLVLADDGELAVVSIAGGTLWSAG